MKKNSTNLVSANADLDELLSREDLKEMIKKDFLQGNYETSITKAFAHLEETIIYSGQKSLSEEQKINYVSNDKTNEELRAIRFKLKGAMNWFREPNANGTQSRAKAAAQILAYVDLQLTVTEKMRSL